jgi:hypothetical protein
MLDSHEIMKVSREWNLGPLANGESEWLRRSCRHGVGQTARSSGATHPAPHTAPRVTSFCAPWWSATTAATRTARASGEAGPQQPGHGPARRRAHLLRHGRAGAARPGPVERRVERSRVGRRGGPLGNHRWHLAHAWLRRGWRGRRDRFPLGEQPPLPFHPAPVGGSGGTGASRQRGSEAEPRGSAR